MRETQQILSTLAGQRDLLSAFLSRPENEQAMIHFLETPTEEYFLEIDLRFQHFCFECRFVHYMSKFIYFQSINHIRKLRRSHQKMYDMSDSDDFVSKDHEPIHSYVQTEFGCPVLVRAIKKLTALQQQVIHFHYQREWKLKEISSLLKVSPQSISKTHRRALQQIKMWMEGEHHVRRD